MVSCSIIVFVGEQHATEHVREAFDYHRREIDNFLCICPTLNTISFVCRNASPITLINNAWEKYYGFFCSAFCVSSSSLRPRTLLTLPESSHSRNVGTETLLFITEPFSWCAWRLFAIHCHMQEVAFTLMQRTSHSHTLHAALFFSSLWTFRQCRQNRTHNPIN